VFEHRYLTCEQSSALEHCSARQFRLDQSDVDLGMSLTDAQWARIEPLLPDRKPKRGGRWRDHREVIDAIAFKFRTGTQWVHLPEKYGNWRGVYNRLRMWAVDGTWERVFTALMAQADADKELDWVVSVDSTIVRAHQHAARARKRGPGGRAARPRHRTVARGTYNEDPSCCRRPLSPPRVCPDRRSSGRRTHLHGRHGRAPCTAPPRTASNQA